MDSNDVKVIESLMKLFAQSLENLYHEERDIIKSNVNERCMAAHVFSYMKGKWNCYENLMPYQIFFLQY